MTSSSPMLKDKVIIVTGAASGMGRATARTCAEHGAAVVAADLNGDGAQAVADGITASGGAAVAHQLDLTVEDQVAGLAEAAIARFGRIDALHNNAYAIHPGATSDLLSTSLESWEWTLRTCLTSQFLCCRAVIPPMIAGGGGSIINVSSGSGIAGSPSAAAYGAAKAGIIVLTKYVATQYGKRGIRCNTVVPGWTVGGTSWAKPEDEQTDADRQFLNSALADVCLPRLADADDVAPVVAFLASDGARYVQGATIEVNGGLLAHMPGLAGAPAAG
jgi:NAD(P)-dependent dehydrogenase (short-subunit alcohol dehydrogenase family)